MKNLAILETVKRTKHVSGLGPFLPEPAAFGSCFLQDFNTLFPFMSVVHYMGGFFFLFHTRAFCLDHFPPIWTFETDISWFR